MKIEVSIPASYFNQKLKSTIVLLLIYCVIGILVLVVFAINSAKTVSKPLISIAKSLAVSVLEYNSIAGQIDNLHSTILDSKNKLCELLLSKMPADKLSDAEEKLLFEVTQNFPEKFFMVYVHDKNFILDNYPKLCAASFTSVSYNASNSTLFIDAEKMTPADAAREIKENTAILSVNTNIIIGSVLTGAENIYGEICKMQTAAKYSENHTVNLLSELPDYYENIDSVVMSKEDAGLLKRYIRDGISFEANKIIYSLWYNITENPCGGNEIEALYYSLHSLLTQLSFELGCNTSPDTYNAYLSVTELDFILVNFSETLCEYVINHKSNCDRRGQMILNYINKNYTKQDLYMPVLEKEFNLSNKTITQIIKTQSGMNFSNYLNNLRLTKAAEMLTKTTYSVNEIAQMVGFSLPNTFYKAFKKKYGISANIFRTNEHTDRD